MWRVLSAAAGLCVLAQAARGAAEEPVAVLRRGVDEVLQEVYLHAGSAEPPSQRLRPILERYFDFEGITRRALGPAGKTFTPEELSRTTALFSELVLRTYADRFEPKEKPAIAYGTEARLAPDRVEVPTTITYQGQNYSVAYRMQRKGETWRVYDVVIEGVSMISNYRAQFDELLQKGGPARLLRLLEENLAASKTP
jgi:phospholipid transport system substrate-binding protein